MMRENSSNPGPHCTSTGSQVQKEKKEHLINKGLVTLLHNDIFKPAVLSINPGLPTSD